MESLQHDDPREEDREGDAVLGEVCEGEEVRGRGRLRAGFSPSVTDFVGDSPLVRWGLSDLICTLMGANSARLI